MPYELVHRDGDLILRNKYGTYSRRELQEQLTEGRFTLAELGKIYDLKAFQVRHIFKALKISDLNTLGATRVDISRFPSSLHQALLGTLAGDAYMKSKNSYAVAHSVSQADYCYDVAGKIHPFVSSIGLKNRTTVVMWTFSHDALSLYYDLFYSQGPSKKYFTSETLDGLDWQGLAYWFMDDGKRAGYGYYLCVGKITDEEMKMLLDLLRDKFHLSVSSQHHHRAKQHRYIYIRAADRDRFRSCVLPFMVPSLRYKLDGRRCSREHDLVDLHVRLQKIAGRPIRFCGDEKISSMIRERHKIKDPKEIYGEKIRRDISQRSQISRTHLKDSFWDRRIK